MDKTKVMMEYTQSFTYLEVTFTGPRFSRRLFARFFRGYAALGPLESTVARARAKLYGSILIWAEWNGRRLAG